MQHSRVIPRKIWGKLSKIPISLVTLLAILYSYGLIVLASAAEGSFYPWAYKQVIHLIVLLPVMLGLVLIDLRQLYNLSWLIYFAVIVALIAVEILGYTVMGATRWIGVAGFRGQPSEPAKIAIVMMLARYFHGLNESQINQIKYLIPPILAVLVPVGLIIKQPDLGTGILTLLVAAIIFFAAGVSITKFLVVGVAGLASLPILWNFLYDYQKKRILVFLNPEADPLGAGYNIMQSKIAIGSGGLWGKGFSEGTQNHLNFLPEHQTDFIFASLSEEFGFCGGMLLLFLYASIIYIAISIAINARSFFGKLLVIGIAGIFFCHIFINIAMVMGWMPAVGIPLPFMSYGGTMMSTMLCGFALIINVHINHSTHVGK